MSSSVDGDITLKLGFDSSGVKKGVLDIGKSIQQSMSKMNSKNTSSSMLGLRNQINKVINDLEKAEAKKKELAETTIYSDDYKRMQADIQKYEKSMSDLHGKMQELKNEQRELSQQTVPTQKYQQMADELRRVHNAMNDARKIGAQPEFIDTYKQQIHNIISQMKALKEQGKAFEMSPEALKSYNTLENKIEQLQSSYSKARTNAQALRGIIQSTSFRQANVTMGTETQAYKDADNRVRGLESRLEQLATRYREAGEAGQSSGNRQSLGAKVAHKAWSGFRGSLGAIGKGISKLKKDSTDSFNDITKSAKAMFWKILKYALSIRSLYALIKKLRTTFSNSIKVMGMDIPRIRDELNSLINGFTQVKYQLATAFQPIFSYIVPALNTLISALNSAMIALANFFATFTGQKVIYKATKQNKDYAKSISGAGKAAEDANEDIAEYDKLIVINQDKDSGGGGGGGSSDLDSGIFEEAPAKINEFAQLIKKAWKDADFTDVGEYIGNKLNKGLESIKWTKIKETAGRIGRSFATLINGIVKVPNLGTNIGKTLAEAFNTGFTTVNNFVRSLNWAGVGRFVGETVAGYLTTLDLSMLGENIGLGLTGVATALFNVFETLNNNLPDILKNINDGIDKFLEAFDPVEIGKAFGEVSKFVLDFVDGILPKIPDIASELGDLFNELIKNLPAEKLAQTISDFIRTALQSATEFIKKVDFEELGKKIGEFISNLDLMGFVGDLANLLWEVVKGAFKALPGLIKEAPLETALIGAFALMKFSKWGAGLATTLGSTVSTSLLGGALQTKIAGVFTKIFSWTGWAGAAIIAAIGGWKIGNAIYNVLPKDAQGDNIFDNLVDMWLGGDPRETMKKATRDLDFKSLIYEELQNPYYQARQEVEKLGLTGKEAYNYLATELDKIDVDSFIEANKTGVAEIDEDAKQLLETWKEEQLASAEAKYGLDEVKKSYAGIPTEAQEAMAKANTSVSSGIDDLNTQAGEVSKTYNGMPSEIQDSLERANSAIYQNFDKLKTKFEDIRGVLEGTPEEVKTKIEEMQGALAESFGVINTKADEVKQTYNGMPSDIQAQIETTNGQLSTSFEGLREKIDGISESVKGISLNSGLDSLKNQITELKEKTDAYKKSTTNAGNKVQRTTKTLTDNFNTLTDKVSTLKQKTDDYNEKLQATNDTVSKSLEDTSNKAQNVGTSLSRAFTKTKNNLVNLAGEVKQTWYEKIKGTVTDLHTELSGGIDNLGQDTMKNLALSLADDSEVILNAGNLGKNINSAMSSPFTGTQGAASILKQSFIQVAQDEDGAIAGANGFGSLGEKIRTAMGNLFDKIGLKTDYTEAISELGKLEENKDSGGLKGIAYRVMDYWRTKMFQMKHATIEAYTQGKNNIDGQEKPQSGLHKIAENIATYWGKKFVLVRKAMTNAYDKGLQHYQNGEKGNGGFSKIADGITTAFSKIKTTVVGTGKNDSLGNAMVNNLTGAWGTIVNYFNGGKSLTDASDNIRNSYSDTADIIKEKFGQAWEALKNAFGNSTIEIQVTDNIKKTLIGALQALAININSVFSNFVTSFNKIVDKLNSSESMFKRFGNAIYQLALENYQVPVPGLAQGGVIPPNKEFLAVLGDQKQGMNIETPLQTMIDAFNTALDRRGNSSSNSAPIVLQLNGREIARAVWDEDKKKYKQTGKYSPNYM